MRKTKKKRAKRGRLTKAQVVRGVSNLRVKKRKKDSGSDAIFDSETGKTDALFVDVPE